MRIYGLLALMLLMPLMGRGQEEPVTLDDLLQAGQQWLQENVDQDVLELFQKADRDKIDLFFQELHQSLQGDDVLDLAKLKPVAVAILPMLEQYEETLPYAAWLKARMDYFDISQRLSPSPSSPTADQASALKLAKPKTGPEAERKAWQTQLEKRPAPKSAETLVSRLKPIFAAQNVPPQLVWMAEIESSFDPQARSPAGAAGLFQLMPATAQSLGLDIRPRDERLSPEKNARAASAYLETLYEKFGDWPLAIAAYNAGETRVRSLLLKHEARTFEEIARYLPAETQMYVPRVDATLRLREGVQLAKLKSAKGSVVTSNRK